MVDSRMSRRRYHHGVDDGSDQSGKVTRQALYNETCARVGLGAVLRHLPALREQIAAVACFIGGAYLRRVDHYPAGFMTLSARLRL